MSVSLKILIIFFLAAGSIAIFIAMAKSKHFIRCFLFSAVTGLGSLLAVHFTSLMSGISLPVNFISIPAGALGGIPAVIAMIVTKFI